MFQCTPSYSSFRLLSRLLEKVDCTAPSSRDANNKERPPRIGPVLSNNPIAPIYNQVLNALQRSIEGVIVASSDNGLFVVIEFQERFLSQQGGIGIHYALVNSMDDGLNLLDEGQKHETILVEDRAKLLALLRHLQDDCEVLPEEVCGYKVCKGIFQPPL